MTTTLPAVRSSVRSYRTQTSAVLGWAFGISLAHAVYASVAGLAPGDFSPTNPVLWVFYLLGFAMTVAVRTDRRVVWQACAVLLPLLLAVGWLYYPSVFTARVRNTAGWFENDAYMGLLMLAEYLVVQRLRGVRLTP